MKKAMFVAICIVMAVSMVFTGCTGKPEEKQSAATQSVAKSVSAETSAAASVAASSSTFNPSDKYLGIVCYPSSNTTIKVWMSGFIQTAEKLGYKGLYIGGDTTDAATVEQMIDSAIAQYDNLIGVALCINSETRWNMAKKFTDAKIYVISGWTAISKDSYATYGINGDYILGYHATDSYKYGKEAAKVIGDKVGGKGTVAITQNTFNNNENAAAKGFKEVMAANYPNIKVLDPQVESADVTTGIGVVTAIIQANFSDLVGAFGTTGTSAQSWSTAAKNTGWKGAIVGMDATSANLDVLESGGVYALVAQPMYDAWAECAKHFDDFFTGKKTYKYENTVDSPIIFAADVSKYRDLLKGIDTYKDFGKK